MAARRERLVRLEKVNRGELPPQSEVDVEEEQEHMDYRKAHGKQGMTSAEQRVRDVPCLPQRGTHPPTHPCMQYAPPAAPLCVPNPTQLLSTACSDSRS